MATRDFLIRIEGVNFDATINDTNDLSTIRGGSLALLRLAEAVTEALPGARLITSGASQAVFRCPAEGAPADVAARIRRDVGARFAGGPDARGGGDRPPFGQLTVVVDAVPDLPGAIARLEAMNHARQLRQWTVVPLRFAAAPGNRADPFDGVRPASEPVRLPPGKVLTLDDRDGGATVALSPSVAARRAFGRRARQRFYRTELPDTWKARLRAEERAGVDAKALYSFTNSTEDMVAEAPRGLAPSPVGKIAVVYADGNAFGALRDRLGAEAFGAKLAPLRRDLLDRTLRWYTESEAEKEGSPFVVWDPASRTYGLRLETLLWGGDELMFVLPSWLAVAFVQGFFAATRDWTIGGSPLTHAVGVAIAHHKTPIRQLQAIAHAAADLAKEAGLRQSNSVTFDVFESLAPPDIGIGTARARVFQTADDRDGHLDLARSLAISGDAFDDVVAAIERAKSGAAGALPRSQLYGALRAVRARVSGGDYRDPDATRVVEEIFDVYARRMGLSAATLIDRIPRFGDRTGRRALAFDVAMTTAFWDYVEPLGTRLPAFPAEEV
jgi:hypothetical protein